MWQPVAASEPVPKYGKCNPVAVRCLGCEPCDGGKRSLRPRGFDVDETDDAAVAMGMALG